MESFSPTFQNCQGNRGLQKSAMTITGIAKSLSSCPTLPSAGIIPVMQIFCPKAVRDPYGFPEHPKSQVTSFLNQLEDVINRNKMFNEEFDLKSIKMLPDTFNDLIFYDGSIENKFANAGCEYQYINLH
ncbi:putative ATP-binding cassette sub-family A member 2 [Apostichopus japonicus]|uniref:Putative ATP-binding cassette sub-family A member 2 n=1 Tax=Stichopus japonicus TaxID=307972 RepID=A0A2G8KAC4_STIJA|nr:putative ATP-binding cassette sub-family A member 2 [Apostichopus japonicus]